jgi:hypothetical protein
MKRGDFKFWKEVREVMFTFNGAKTIANYLLSRDISEFQVRKLPENDFQESIVHSEETPEDKFIAQWDGTNTKASELFQNYINYCSENRLKYDLEDVKYLDLQIHHHV